VKLCDKTAQNCISENAHIGQNDDVVATQNGQPTKSRLLAELLMKPESYKPIDSAWRLTMWLMLVVNGVTVCGYDEIAVQLDSNKSTVKHWADSLVAKGIVDRKPKGKRVELRLTGDYLRIATATDVIYAERPTAVQQSPSTLCFTKILEGAKGLGGRLTITIGDCDLGGVQ
jgi:DNA-binding transcriptional ArsR family regulator